MAADDWVSKVQARLQAIAAGEASVSPTKDAATVVLLRDDPSGRPGVEVYLLRRVSSMAFAAGMHVFPGGGVDPRDAEGELAWHGPAASEWAQVLTAPDAGQAQALVCAAVRETFEECGVLLAGTPEQVITDLSDDSFETDRQALLDRSLAFADLLRRRNLVLRADLLRPWAHWITPEVEPKRYDTRFFVARLPEGQVPRDVSTESDHALWIRPDEALAQHRAGTLAMLPPTAFTLAELTEMPSAQGVFDAAAERDVKPVLPRLIVTGDQMQVLMPGDEGYA